MDSLREYFGGNNSGIDEEGWDIGITGDWVDYCFQVVDA